MNMTFEEISEEVYGYPVCAFPSNEGDSIFFVTPGKKEIDRRMLAVFSKIRRLGEYLPLLNLTPVQYLQYGYGKVEGDPENIVNFTFILEDEELEEGYVPITFVEF